MTPVDIDKLKGLTDALEDIRLSFERIAALPANEQPHYPSGMRPFGSGDLRHIIEVLSNAEEELASTGALIAKAERVDALEPALRKHGKHDGLCARIGGYGYCSCGLEAELDALSPKESE